MTGTNKKMNFPILKAIRLTEEQDKKWDSKKIRSFLGGSSIEEDVEFLKSLYELMGTKMDFIETPTDEDIELITRIKEMIE